VHETTLVLVMHVVQGARLEAMRVLCLQQLGAEQGLEHPVVIICGLRLLALVVLRVKLIAIADLVS